ncbi:unnamed protein product [Schistosoma margrebowiei]|uniref:Uncharacterized protein n=1 Tax=Schistosoma margrebowiei TaxID=48269 RepID=A0A183LH07_9TREM|nr:unnamed protein product [Schistosoma margrebowiei]
MWSICLVYKPNSVTVIPIAKACPVEGSKLFIPEVKCNIGKLSGSQQDNIVLNTHEVVTIPNDHKPDPVDEAQSLELNEVLLTLSNSENKLQLEQNYGSCDINREI